MKVRKKATILGFFIIGAIVLFVTFSFLNRSKEAIKDRTYVLYFQGSLKGLHAGSPVTYRGIKIGQVSNIEIEIDSDHYIRIPVYIQFFKRFKNDPNLSDISELIKDGLRARLDSYSIIPNVNSVEIDFYPNTTANLVSDTSPYPEIPTIKPSSGFDDLPVIISEIEKTVTRINKLVGSPKVEAAIDNLNKTLSNTKKLTNTINNNANPLLVNLNDTLKSLSRTSQSIQTMSEYLSRHPESLISGKHK
jgi:paraquat-inducible protein B